MLKRESPGVLKAPMTAGADPMVRETAEDSPLHRATRNENQTSIRVLLEARAQLEEKNDGGDKPLHHAVQKDNSGVLEALQVAEGGLGALKGRK